MDLKGKVVVITGAGKGLGRALAEHFMKEGSRVVASSRSENDLKSLTKDNENVYIVADVAREKDVMKIADFAVKRFGRIDIWINNAGIWIPHGPAEEIDMKAFHEMMEINLFGTVYGSKAALMQMKKQKSGTIMNIISTSALEGRVGSSGYCASKFAADGFTKSVRKEVESSDISVINIYPGGIKTDLFREKKPSAYGEYMDPNEVAEKTIDNLKKDRPEEELIIRRAAFR